MPLSARTRVEIFIPDLPLPEYQDLLSALESELTHNFGGVTIVRGLDGSYLSSGGHVVRDRVNLLFSDTRLSISRNPVVASRYLDELRKAVFAALNEEAVLVAVFEVYHSEG